MLTMIEAAAVSPNDFGEFSKRFGFLFLQGILIGRLHYISGQLLLSSQFLHGMAESDNDYDVKLGVGSGRLSAQ
jgi:hypothetical protein